MTTILDEYIFGPEEFELMLFNPTTTKQGTDLLKIPALSKIGNWQSVRLVPGIDKDKLIRYICLYYDPYSPSAQIKDYVKRKLWCACMAGFEYDEEGMFNSDVDDMLRNKNREANLMIIDFLIEFNDIDYSAIRVGTEAYNNKLFQINNLDISSKTKNDVEIEKIRGELWKQALAMQQDIHTMTERFLKDDSKLLKKDLFCVINKSAASLKLNPESRAKKSAAIFAP